MNVSPQPISGGNASSKSLILSFVSNEPSRYGPLWVTEALFPSCIVARFDWANSLRRVYYSPGVCEVVHFGCHRPIVPEKAIEELRLAFGPDEIRVIRAEMSPGDDVQIAGGCFHGLHAVVSHVMPNKKRVAVLLDFLGNQTQVEIDPSNLIKETGGALGN
jgi:transcription antitermination factor NusG